MTDFELKCLRALAQKPLTGVELARGLWPDSPGWRKEVNCDGSWTGKGFIRNNNAGMSRPAKAAMCRLIHRGFVRDEPKSRNLKTQFRRFELTVAGMEAIK